MAVQLKIMDINVSSWIEMSVRFKKPEQSQDDYKEAHKLLVNNFFSTIISKKSPDIITMQSLHDNLAQKEFREEMKNNGYTIIGGNGPCIAYRTDKFQQLCVNEMNPGNRGHIYADLQENTSGKVICVVSNYLSGFNAKMHKETVKICKGEITTNSNMERSATQQNIQRYQNLKKEVPKQGDDQLKNSLDEIQKKHNKIQPDLIVYGLVANTTAKFVENRLHPKRLQQSTHVGFICDEQDKAPTTVDYDTEQAMRYDYLYVKALNGQVSIQSQVLGPAPDAYDQFFTDHRPVMAHIQLHSPSLISRFMSFPRIVLATVLSLITGIFVWKIFKQYSHRIS